MSANQGPARYWLGTCFCDGRPAELPSDTAWIKGQQEECPTSGRLHWQLFVAFTKNQRIGGVRSKLCGCHWEPSRSQAAELYVWKEDTRVEGTQFEIGGRPFKRNSQADWGQVLSIAKTGILDDIPADIYIRYYRSLCAIASDHAACPGIEKTVNVFYGATGTGKSRRAWAEGGVEAYSKDPRSKVTKINVSGGTVTRVKKMLSSMNFEEQLTLPTYSDGSIVTLFVWSEKARPFLSRQKLFGLLRTLLQEDGTLI